MHTKRAKKEAESVVAHSKKRTRADDIPPDADGTHGAGSDMSWNPPSDLDVEQRPKRAKHASCDVNIPEIHVHIENNPSASSTPEKTTPTKAFGGNHFGNVAHLTSGIPVESAPSLTTCPSTPRLKYPTIHDALVKFAASNPGFDPLPMESTLVDSSINSLDEITVQPVDCLWTLTDLDYANLDSLYTWAVNELGAWGNLGAFSASLGEFRHEEDKENAVPGTHCDVSSPTNLVGVINEEASKEVDDECDIFRERSQFVPDFE
ncbi:hypothetical protein C8J56DRAFT_901784 [Mycena floridula]|nr:hypothetical protein C8J56DRAFT_901784 [Mycena floridula]